MGNPLLLNGLPRFSLIQAEHVVPAIEQTLAENREKIQFILKQTESYQWENLVAPLEDLEDMLSRRWSPVSHMNSVMNNEALRQAYEACLPLLSSYATELGQNSELYAAFLQLSQSKHYLLLNQAQQKVIENALRDFRLSGVALSESKKQRYKDIMESLSQLTNQYENNLLDATNAWKKQISDETLLDGLPQSALAMTSQAATSAGLTGWLFGLDFPSYRAMITFAKNRELREEFYSAYVTRASDVGEHKGKWDNSPVMEKIMALRHEMAQLLGFKNYAERSLATKMAKTTDQVMVFLRDLAERALPMARQEIADLRQFARSIDQLEELEAWDVAYYSEKLRQHRYHLSQEDLKPYFSEPKVLQGLFAVAGKLYGMQFMPKASVDVWHKDVTFYEICDAHGQLRGQFYLDLYAREHKRSGAWMDECIRRKKDKAGVQIPVAYLTCNFSPPVGNHPALFTHDEVLTLFHEFGHGLHHMLTQVDYPSVSGINGVPWDAVELPSQFMENWCWEREALDMFARHYETAELIPTALYERMMAAKNFQAGMQMVRQVELALFDFRLHLEYEPARGARLFEILEEIRQQMAVIRPPSYNRFPHSFSHIFAGGYAAGYYSYKWAEVLSSDAFAKFEDNGIFDPQTGRQFLESILEQGGSRDPMTLFIEFRGREPQIDALLRHSGITA